MPMVHAEGLGSLEAAERVVTALASHGAYRLSIEWYECAPPPRAIKSTQEGR